MTQINRLINFGKALKEFRMKAELSQEGLALEAELDRTYVSMLERNLKLPTILTIVKLSKALSISPTSLFARSLQLESSSLEYSDKREKIRTPFMGTSVSCGKPVNEEFNIEKEISIEEYILKKPESTFFVKASGDSMAPTIWNGDLLVIELNRRYKNNDIVLVQINNEFTVKRYFNSSKGIRLVPDNGLYNETLISDETTISLCGIVTNIVRTL